MFYSYLIKDGLFLLKLSSWTLKMSVLAELTIDVRSWFHRFITLLLQRKCSRTEQLVGDVTSSNTASWTRLANRRAKQQRFDPNYFDNIFEEFDITTIKFLSIKLWSLFVIKVVFILSYCLGWIPRSRVEPILWK